MGFYARGAGAGRGGRDFLTSPEVGPLFGAVLADFLDGVWAEWGEPDQFLVVEGGAGRGALAIAIRAARPRCADALAYVMVERSQAHRHAQAEHLPLGLLGRAGWSSAADLSELPASERGIVLANELFDNLATDVWELVASGTQEWLVDVDAGSCGWTARRLATDTATDFTDVARGRKFPRAVGAQRWLDEARSVIASGLAVAFDYGAASAELAERGDWLRTYVAHTRGADPFAEPGSRDITCDVPWDQLRPDRLVTQREFLIECGLERRLDEARKFLAQYGASPLNLAAARHRSALVEAEALTDPSGLGAFGVATWHWSR